MTALLHRCPVYRDLMERGADIQTRATLARLYHFAARGMLLGGPGIAPGQ